MTPQRRRWLTALGLFLATALGGVIAYLVARRRPRQPSAPEELSVSELSARLRREAATQERRVRHRPAGGRGLGRRRGRWPASRPAPEK